jgi:hypothetical protein
MSNGIDIAAFEANIAAADNSVGQEAATVATVGDNAGQKPVWWSTQNAMTISAAVLLFGAVVIAIAARNTPADTSLEAKLRLYGTVMVITMAAFLVVAGYDDNQIAAPLGLLGTIAGYLLGQRGAPHPQSQQTPPQAPFPGEPPRVGG